jgi:hypothetical protein
VRLEATAERGPMLIYAPADDESLIRAARRSKKQQ